MIVQFRHVFAGGERSQDGETKILHVQLLRNNEPYANVGELLFYILAIENLTLPRETHDGDDVEFLCFFSEEAIYFQYLIFVPRLTDHVAEKLQMVE